MTQPQETMTTEPRLNEAQAAVVEKMRAQAGKEWWNRRALGLCHLPNHVDDANLAMLAWLGLIQKDGNHGNHWRLTVEGLALPF